MKKYSNWIIIGGTGRNIGKTTLAEKLIRKFSAQVPVTAVKMSNIRRENMDFHGHDVSRFKERIRIEQETRTDGNKDSMRFLKAGAEKAWFIQTKDELLKETFGDIEKIIQSAKGGICESNTLQNFFRPGIFIVIHGNSVQTKADGLLEAADVVVDALNEKALDHLVRRIRLKNGKFILLPDN